MSNEAERLLGYATDRLVHAAEDILFEGEYDDCGSYIIRNTDGAESIDEIDELSEALREYQIADAKVGGEPLRWYHTLGQAFNVFAWVVGVIYLFQIVWKIGTAWGAA